MLELDLLTKKEESTSLKAFALSRNMSEEMWYFDSGCSQHMTGNRNILLTSNPHVKTE